MALYSAKTWVEITSYNSWLFSRHRIPRGTGTFTKHLLLGYLSQLIFMIFQSSCKGFKSMVSPGHSMTDISLISIMCFADLG